MDLTTLKKQEDEQQLRVQALLAHFIPFRDGCVKAIEAFMQEAQLSGLTEFGPLQKITDTPEVFHATFSIAGFHLIIIATNDVYQIEPDEHSGLAAQINPPWAARILLYFQGNTSAPHTEITFKEGLPGQYKYTLRWLTTNGWSFVGAGKAMDEADGRQAGIQLVNHYCTFDHRWLELPSLDAMLAHKGADRKPFGFVP